MKSAWGCYDNYVPLHVQQRLIEPDIDNVRPTGEAAPRWKHQETDDLWQFGGIRLSRHDVVSKGVSH